MTDAARLYQLQMLDATVARLERALAALDDGSAMRAQVAQAGTEEEQTRVDLHAKQARLRALELELQSTIGKAKKVEQEMYSGRVSHPKELAAMQQDVQLLTRQRDKLEDEMLDLMEAIERALDTAGAAGSQRQELDRALEVHLEAHRDQTQALTAELESTRAQRETFAAGLEPDLLRRYDRLRGRKDGVAVAAVIDGICEGCHVAIPEGRVSEVMEGVRLYTCEGCGRILYVGPN